jgi:transcriptional regulator with XRE-family HTH domain
MEPQRPPASSAPGATTPAWKQAGAVVRAARIRSGLTLADLGRQCGYSASQISRYERGVQPLTDVNLLRRFADLLSIPYQVLGLADPAGALALRHAESNQPMAAIGGPNLVGYFRREDGDDPVRRREMLAGAAGLASAALLAPASAHANPAERQSSSFDDLLYGQPASPVSLTALRTAIAVKREDFQTARYDRLATGLPALIGMAAATRQCTSGDAQSAASSLLADAYIIAANFMVKLHDDPLALTLADRALQSAQAGADPLTTADASRAVATVLRRTGRRAKANDLLLSAATAIEPGRDTTPEQLSVYGTLLQVAAYTTAVDGNRATAHHLIGEAKTAATRLGSDANYRYTAFGPAKSPSTRSASPRYSATTAPRSSTPRPCDPPPSPPLSGRARTGLTSPAPTTSGTNQNPATARYCAPNAPPRLRSATGHQSTA